MRSSNEFVRMTVMKSYLKDTLGLNVDLQTWNQTDKLPAELTEKKKFFILSVCGVKSLAVCVSAADFQWTLFMRQKAELQEYCNYPIVLCFDRINSYQRKVLITGNQAFIVPENQLYMPYLGISLQEHFKVQTEVKEQMTAMAQFILLYFWHQKDGEYISKLTISKDLDVNLMNISRGVQELEELGLLITKKKGRSSMVCLTESREVSYEKAYPYLRSPVQRELFVRAKEEILSFPVSGEEALFHRGLAERPAYRVRAVDKKYFNEHLKNIESVDPNWANEELIRLQVWRYAPIMPVKTVASDKNEVDLISFALSLEGKEADNLKEAIKQFLA